jgi:hypothetical protein
MSDNIHKVGAASMARKRVKLPTPDLGRELKSVISREGAKRHAEEDARKKAAEAEKAELFRKQSWRGGLSSPPKLEAKTVPIKVVEVETKNEPPVYFKVRHVDPKQTSPMNTPDVNESPADDKPSADPSDWAAVIRERIAAEGWSTYALGIHSGVDPSILLRFIAGQRDIRLGTAIKLGRSLGLILLASDDR